MDRFDQMLLLSLRPSFGEMILRGDKTVELRRTRPGVQKGQWGLIYLSAPRKALAGAFEILGVRKNSPEALWRRHGKESGLSREEFDSYFEGAATGYAIQIGRVCTFQEAIPLASLRRKWPGFHPPQSFRYVPTDHTIVPQDLLLQV